MDKQDELSARVAKLEAELEQAKQALEALQPKKPFVPTVSMQPIDWTAGMKMSPDAAEAMARVVPDPPKKADMGAWARNRTSVPGGFGPSDARGWQKGAAKVKPSEKLDVPPQPKSYWSK
jgi:hypothetical protein